MTIDEISCADVAQRIRSSLLIPVISNSLCYEQFFPDRIPNDSEFVQKMNLPPCQRSWTIENCISKAWADEIKYPLPDCHEMARVAQYNYNRTDRNWDPLAANTDYLRILKDFLLKWFEKSGRDPALIKELRDRAQEDNCTFSFLAQEMDYFHNESKEKNSLYILARLPFKIYITTSYHDFVERELIRAGKEPVTQVCFWRDENPQEPNYNTSILDKCRVQADKQLAEKDISPERPWVYHLYGLERYPSTLVLSEDDYIDFLMKITQDNIETKYNPKKDSQAIQRIPLLLYSSMATSTLFLVGYRLSDWDLRILFRGIIEPNRPNRKIIYNFIIQLAPDEQYQITTVNQANEYLDRYFKNSEYRVRLDNATAFLNELWVSAFDSGKKI